MEKSLAEELEEVQDLVNDANVFLPSMHEPKNMPYYMKYLQSIQSKILDDAGLSRLSHYYNKNTLTECNFHVTENVKNVLYSSNLPKNTHSHYLSSLHINRNGHISPVTGKNICDLYNYKHIYSISTICENNTTGMFQNDETESNFYHLDDTSDKDAMIYQQNGNMENQETPVIANNYVYQHDISCHNGFNYADDLGKNNSNIKTLTWLKDIQNDHFKAVHEDERNKTFIDAPLSGCLIEKLSYDNVRNDGNDNLTLNLLKSQSRHKNLHQRKKFKFPICSTNYDHKNFKDCDGYSRINSFDFNAIYLDLSVTHRGMHRFIPRHVNEISIETGDPIHVKVEADDLWCEGINLRTGEEGIFPSMYATNLDFLENDNDDDIDDGMNIKKFNLQFLGSIEVKCHRGLTVLCQAITKVAVRSRLSGKLSHPPMCLLEVSDYGVRLVDNCKSAHENNSFSHFFSLKNISFCGQHPRNRRYFAFITKHPVHARFACHVLVGEKCTRNITEAVELAIQRFHREYMAFIHQTEDIYLE